MKLSQAIRDGAQLRPQGFGQYFMQEKPETRSCALGAAFECVTGNTSEVPFDARVRQTLVDRFPCLAEWAQHPVHGVLRAIGPTILNLNDHEHWTREQIADWLEGLGY